MVMFAELVNMVVAGGEQTGFVMPSYESYMPEAFFTVDALAPVYELAKKDEVSDVEVIVKEKVRRVKRQAQWQQTRIWAQPSAWQTPAVQQQTAWQWQATQQAGRIRQAAEQQVARRRQAGQQQADRRRQTAQAQDARQSGVWTRTAGHEAEFYFREDPVANAHHTEWHRMSGRRFSRSGEHFYYMHGQMLARYEAERLSLGLGLTNVFESSQWRSWISDSYDPRLGWEFAARPAGMINSQQMYVNDRNFRGLMNQLSWGGYRSGVDWNIDRLGQELDLHNNGHNTISAMSGNRGVMASSLVSMRDPIFYRWHAYLERLLKIYKNRLIARV